MCKCLPQSTITVTGIIVTILMGILTIPCIVLSGVDYQQTDMRWTSVGPWFRTGSLKVGCIVVVFVSMILAFISFSFGAKSRPMLAIIYYAYIILYSFASLMGFLLY